MSVTRQNVPQRPSTKSPLHSPAGKAASWNLKPLAAGCPSSRGSGACTSSGTPGWCRLYLAALHTRFRLLAQARRGRQGLCQAASSKDKPCIFHHKKLERGSLDFGARPAWGCGQGTRREERPRHKDGEGPGNDFDGSTATWAQRLQLPFVCDAPLTEGNLPTPLHHTPIRPS